MRVTRLILEIRHTDGDPAKWAWTKIVELAGLEPAEGEGIRVESELVDHETGPWDDGGANVMFRPFAYGGDVVGFDIERGGKWEHVVCHPRPEGYSPAVCLYRAEGKFKHVGATIDDAQDVACLTICGQED